MQTFYIVLSLGITILCGRLLYKVMFSDLDDLLECVGSCFTPDIVSAWRGTFYEDFIESLKFHLFLTLSVVPGCGCYFFLTEL